MRRLRANMELSLKTIIQEVTKDMKAQDIQDLLDEMDEKVDEENVRSEELNGAFCDILGLGEAFYELLNEYDINVVDELTTIQLERNTEAQESSREALLSAASREGEQ